MLCSPTPLGDLCAIGDNYQPFASQPKAPDFVRFKLGRNMHRRRGFHVAALESRHPGSLSEPTFSLDKLSDQHTAWCQYVGNTVGSRCTCGCGSGPKEDAVGMNNVEPRDVSS